MGCSLRALRSSGLAPRISAHLQAATARGRWAPAVGSAGQRQLRQQWRCVETAAGWGRSARDWAPPPQEQLGWESSDSDSDTDEDLDLFPEQMSGDPEFVAENVLALVLISICALAGANIALKLLIIAYSLLSAGIRYTVVGLFLAVLLTQVQPGRWWF